MAGENFCPRSSDSPNQLLPRWFKPPLVSPLDTHQRTTFGKTRSLFLSLFHSLLFNPPINHLRESLAALVNALLPPLKPPPPPHFRPNILTTPPPRPPYPRYPPPTTKPGGFQKTKPNHAPLKVLSSGIDRTLLLSSSSSSSSSTSTHHQPARTMVDAPITRSRARAGSISNATTPLSNTPSMNSSSTSLSSMADEKPLVDTYGNKFEIPNFTIKDIRDAIPKHCYNRSAIRGLGYVLRDIVLLATNLYAFQFHIIPALSEQHPAVRGLAWAAYTFMQGLFGTGIWVLAHECGHQAFSESKIVNDTVGWVLHSALLVPYFSWKISHGKHHKATGHLERDMVFVPKTRTEYGRRFAGIGRDIADLTEETPIATLIHVVLQQLFGWPMYILTNVTGHNFHVRQSEGRGQGKKNGNFGGVNHFNPASPLYDAKDAKLIVLSDIGIGITMYLVYLGAQAFGAWNMAIWYGI